MMVEVARLGRPLAIFELPLLRSRIWRALAERARSPRAPEAADRQGLAVRLGEPFAAPLPPPADELPRVIERIRALVDSAGRQPPVAPAQRLAI